MKVKVESLMMMASQHVPFRQNLRQGTADNLLLRDILCNIYPGSQGAPRGPWTHSQQKHCSVSSSQQRAMASAVEPILTAQQWAQFEPNGCSMSCHEYGRIITVLLGK